MAEKLLKASEVAEMLNVKIERVFALSRENILPCIRLGRQLRFSPSKITEFISNGGKALPGGWRREVRP